MNAILDAKVRFLSGTDAYPGYSGGVELRETHMSWVFLTDDRVYKFKKPVKFAYLDFSTLARREAACRAELRVNRRLAADIYLGVVPLTRSGGGYAIDGDGDIVEWLIVMRRLGAHRMLDQVIAENRLMPADVSRLVDKLVSFYRHAKPVFLSPEAYRARWRSAIAYNYALLRDRQFALPQGIVARLYHIQRRFIGARGHLFDRRVRGRHIVDGHGDLRPEHIWLGEPLRIIDSLEFDPRLRHVDPFDEVAYLSLECERVGAAWAGERIRDGLIRALRNGPSAQLFAFYRCYRASLRARLAIAHLAAPDVRTPEKWRPLAQDYLKLALAEARRLERFLRTPADRRSAVPHAADRSPLPATAHRAGYRASRERARRSGGKAVPHR